MSLKAYLEKHKNKFAFVRPVPQNDASDPEGCQGCGYCYKPEDVMIVDELGPICLNCQHRVVKWCLKHHWL